MEPTSVNEAATQLRFLGHDFFMLLDSESDKHSVLYVRGDGNHGMIQPKQGTWFPKPGILEANNVRAG